MYICIYIYIYIYIYTQQVIQRALPGFSKIKQVFFVGSEVSGAICHVWCVPPCAIVLAALWVVLRWRGVFRYPAINVLPMLLGGPRT